MTTNIKNIINKKSLSRLMAIQIYYQFEFFEKKQNLSQITEDVIGNYVLNQDDDLSSYEKNINNEFLSNLIKDLENNSEIIDKDIEEFLNEPWTIQKIDEISLQIIRFGCLELKNYLDTPAKVIIDEYVDIASSFFEEKKIPFVNAMLDKLAKKHRKTEFKNA